MPIDYSKTPPGPRPQAAVSLTKASPVVSLWAGRSLLRSNHGVLLFYASGAVNPKNKEIIR